MHTILRAEEFGNVQRGKFITNELIIFFLLIRRQKEGVGSESIGAELRPFERTLSSACSRVTTERSKASFLLGAEGESPELITSRIPSSKTGDKVSLSLLDF